MIDNLNIKTKMFDFEERVLIGWLANIVIESAIQDRTPKFNIFVFMLWLSIISDPSIETDKTALSFYTDLGFLQVV